MTLFHHTVGLGVFKLWGTGRAPKLDTQKSTCAQVSVAATPGGLAPLIPATAKAPS